MTNCKCKNIVTYILAGVVLVEAILGSILIEFNDKLIGEKDIEKYNKKHCLNHMYASFFYSSQINSWSPIGLENVDDIPISFYVELKEKDIKYILEWAMNEKLIINNKKDNYSKRILKKNDIKLLFNLISQYYKSESYKIYYSVISNNTINKTIPSPGENMIIGIPLYILSEEEKNHYAESLDLLTYDLKHYPFKLTKCTSDLLRKINAASLVNFPN